MTPDLDPALIDRHLAGTASADDARALDAWVAADPARAAWLAALRERVAARDERTWNVEAAWRKVASRTTDAPRVLPLTRSVPARRTVPAWARRAAAAVLLVAGGAGVWRASRQPDAPPAESIAMRELVAPRGGRANVLLVDGTRVRLNAGSRLRYAIGAAGPREVWLDGEGEFEVTHDAARPFRVHAGDGVAEDLGTRFVVRAYPELRRVDVLVTEGRVALRRASAAATTRDVAELGPGQLGTLGAAGAPTVTNDVPAERYVAWTTGALVLDGVPLADALPQLERRYDVRITLADTALGARRVVGRFRDQPVGDVLDALALAIGARWTRSGGDVTLRAAEAP